jgi:hypothetical protein
MYCVTGSIDFISIYPHQNCNRGDIIYILTFGTLLLPYNRAPVYCRSTCPSGVCETPHARSIFNVLPCSFRTTISGTPHDSIPHDTRSIPLRPAKKLHHGPEPRHLRQGAHDLPNSITVTRCDLVSVRGSGCEHGDERSEKGRFERGAEERWEGYRVNRLHGEKKALREREDTGRGWIYVRLVEPSARRCLRKVCRPMRG